jgi:hypothetical protein
MNPPQSEAKTHPWGSVEQTADADVLAHALADAQPGSARQVHAADPAGPAQS